MLTLTDGATRAINELLAGRPGAGLRIYSKTMDNDEVQLGLSVQDSPAPDDQIIEQDGCHVFVDSRVAPIVDGHILDAAQSADGSEVQFGFVN